MLPAATCTLLFLTAPVCGAVCAAEDDACGALRDEVSLLAVSRPLVGGMRRDDGPRVASLVSSSKGNASDEPTPEDEDFVPRFRCADLGPLRQLLGEWKGFSGISVNRVPTAASDPDNGTLYVEYTETMKFEPIAGLVLNRGFKDADHVGQEEVVEQKIYGMAYVQQLKGVFGQGVHAESGQWLFNSAPGVSNWSIAKVSAIPHGAGLVAYGASVTIQDEAEVAREQEQINKLATLGLSEHIRSEMVKGIQRSIDIHRSIGLYKLLGMSYHLNFGDVLQKARAGLVADGVGGDLRARRLEIKTDQVGSGFTMMEDVRLQTPVSDFSGVYWIFENSTTQILQYFQNVYLNFEMKQDAPSSCYDKSPVEPSCLNAWPHFQLATLVKVKDYDDCEDVA